LAARALGAVLIALVLTASGCGGKSDSEAARAAVTGFTKAFGKGDGAKACKLLTPAARDAFLKRVKVLTGTSDCAKALKGVHDAAGRQVTDAFEAAKVSDVEIKGSNATAKVTASGASTTVGLKKQGDKWLLTGVPGV
jgi:hypothetical protein